MLINIVIKITLYIKHICRTYPVGTSCILMPCIFACSFSYAPDGITIARTLTLNRNHVRSLDFAVNSCFRKIF